MPVLVLEVPGSYSGLELANLTEDFLRFIQHFQANAQVVPQIRAGPLFQIFVTNYSFIGL
jgi:hypothetical protein